MKRGNDFTKAIDQQVGANIRARRVALGVTLRGLAEAIGVTCQQLHKYERADTRISCGRLVQIAQALRIHPADLFGSEINTEAVSGEGARTAIANSRLLVSLTPQQRTAVRDVIRAFQAPIAQAAE